MSDRMSDGTSNGVGNGGENGASKSMDNGGGDGAERSAADEFGADEIGADEIGAGPVGPLQRRKPRANGWTIARRRAFLEELAASCNVERARKAAGMASSGVYRLRQRDPLFAEQWQAALTLGYERLEMALLRRAIEAVEGLTADAEDEARQPVEKMTVAEAMGVLRWHRASVERGSARGRRPHRRDVPTQQEVDAILFRRIHMAKRRRAMRHRDGSAVALPAPETGGPGSPASSPSSSPASPSAPAAAAEPGSGPGAGA